jgi:hypothetical protein
VTSSSSSSSSSGSTRATPWHPDHPTRPHRPPNLDLAASLARWDQVSRLPRLLGLRSRAFSFAQTRFNTDPAKNGTGRRELGRELGPTAQCYTLEASFFAATINRQLLLFTPEK